MAKKLIEKEIIKDFLEAFREHADECKKEDLTVYISGFKNQYPWDVNQDYQVYSNEDYENVLVFYFWGVRKGSIERENVNCAEDLIEEGLCGYLSEVIEAANDECEQYCKDNDIKFV